MANIDFSTRYRDYAVFMPAVSEMYARLVVNDSPKRPLPANITNENLNFLDKENGFYFIPSSLYSAGQAAKTKGMAARIDMVTGRDRSCTTLLGDSGGFQIQTGAIKFKGDVTRNRMMKWLETHCDWSMILDFPTGGVDIGTIDLHMPRIEKDLKAHPHVYNYKGNTYTFNNVKDFAVFLGLDTSDEGNIGFAACLLQTRINNDYFVKHRTPGATNFLNVVQGRNLTESNIWYEHIKDYPFEGWALASHHKENFVMAMTRFVDMYHDGLLQNHNWAHMLGVGKLANGCAYTTMQRTIREHINPNFTISYDVSSPFTTTAFGNLFMGYTLDKSSWTIQSGNLSSPEYLAGGSLAKSPFLTEMRKMYDSKKLVDFENGGNSRFVETEVGKRLVMEDLCVNTDDRYASAWDITSYGMLMHHNLQVHLTGVFDAQDMYDKGDTAHVPPGLLRFRDIIPEIFDVCMKKGRSQAKNLIEKYKEDLNFLAGDGARAGVQILTEFDMPKTSDFKKARNRIREFNNSTKSKITELNIVRENNLWA